MLSGFFHLCRKAQHRLTEGQHHFERSENIIVRLRHKTMLRQVANDVLRNDVMLRINDVALRANGFPPSSLEKRRKPCYNKLKEVMRCRYKLWKSILLK